LETLIGLILKSGKSAIDLCLYILIPIMVVMMGFMRLLEKKGILGKLAWFLTPLLALFGLPGIGVFAMLQIMFVNFAAPLSTLSMMDADPQMGKRNIAATLAMVYTMAQANATFPLLSVGLNLPVTLLSSLLGGLISASATYYIFARKEKSTSESLKEQEEHIPEKEKKSIMQAVLEGGGEGVNIVLKSIPMLMLALFLVNVLKAVGAIGILETVLSPVLSLIGIPVSAVLPIATKYLAGGTAMIGVTFDLVKEGALSAVELNRIAGLILHPFDLVGMVFYAAAGSGVASMVKPAIKGALVGILFRTVFHFILF
jgi:spore maturation protein SpmB